MLKLVLSLALVGIFLVQNSCAKVRYDNYKLYNVIAETKDQVELLNEFEKSSDSLIFLSRTKKENMVIVAPHKDHDFRLILQNANVEFSVIDSNVQSSIDEEVSSMGRSGEPFGWNDYHKLEEINQWLMNQAEKYPKIVTVVNIGKSYEKRDILGVKISHKPGNKAVFIDGGIHAREWISPATVTFIINELLTSNSVEVQNLAQNYDWHIFPVVNPDGYVHTLVDRMWRTTRQLYGTCFGADANRNFDIEWRSDEENKCSETYSGSSPFSEPESLSLAKYLAQMTDLRTYITFHSYHQALLFPYGFTYDHPKNYDDLMEISNATVEALSVRYGTEYIYDTILSGIEYSVYGCSIDWVYEKLNVKLAFGYELRSRGNLGYKGFELPKEQIIPTGEETMDSLIALIKTSHKLGYYN